ncbi:hypothetical protein V2W45_1452093, partial [Cenococcum geophilum]
LKLELQRGARSTLEVDPVNLIGGWSGFEAAELLELQFSNPIQTVILTFYLTSAMDQYLLIYGPPASNDVILALKSINPAADELKTIKEFKLYSKQYV